MYLRFSIFDVRFLCALVVAFFPGPGPTGKWAGLLGFLLAADPIPLLRIPIQPDRVAAEMEKAQLGVLVKMPREQFEERVKRAARVQDKLKDRPALIETTYRASLVGSGLIGAGQWKMHNPTMGLAVLPLESAAQRFNLALRQVEVGGKEATLGLLDGDMLGLLLEEGGEQLATLSWSARGKSAPDGLHFDLRLPPCGLAWLDLEVPSGAIVSTVSPGCLITGPSPAEVANKKLWRVSFAGRSQVYFRIKPASQLSKPTMPLFVQQLRSRQRLTPVELRAEFEWDIPRPTGGPWARFDTRALVLEYDATLRPYEVIIDGLESWELLEPHVRREASAPPAGEQVRKPGSNAKSPSPAGEEIKSESSGKLHIRLRDAFQGGTLRVHCVAPLVSGTIWTSPGMRLLDSLPAEESLEILLDSGVQLEDWDARGFHVVSNVTGKDGQRISLVNMTQQQAGPNGRAEASENGARPRARVLTRGADFWVRQQTWWKVGPSASSLTSEIQYEVMRGRLFHLAVSLPKDWELDRVELSPSDLRRDVSVRQEAGQDILIINLQRAITAPRSAWSDTIGEPGIGASAGSAPNGSKPGSGGADARESERPRRTAARGRAPRLIVHLRPAATRAPRAAPPESRPMSHAPRTNRIYPLPDIRPLEARFREGGLGVDFEEKFYDGVVLTSAPSAAPEDGPWGKHLPDYYFPYRGEAVEGQLVLQPRRSHLQARCSNEVRLASGRVVASAQLEIQSEGGSPQSIDLCVSSPVVGKWEWKSRDPRNRVQSFERLRDLDDVPLLGLMGSWQPGGAVSLAAAHLLAGSPQAVPQFWRVTLAQPMRPEERFLLEGAWEGEPGAGRWDVPLPTVVGADLMEGRVKFFLPATAQVRHQTDDRLQAVGGLQADSAPAWRTFRYGNAAPALSLHAVTPTGALASQMMIENVELTTHVLPDGRLLHTCKFQVANWEQPTFSLHLPASARFKFALVNGSRIRPVGSPLSALRSLPGGDSEDPAPALISLPVPAESGERSSSTPLSGKKHLYEIAYETKGAPWVLFGRLESPTPVLPVRPLGFRRTWVLPPDVVPLFDNCLPAALTPDLSPSGKEVGLRVPAAVHVDSSCETQWESLGETDQTDLLLVVRQDVMPGFGMSLMALFCLGHWLLRTCPSQTRLAFLLSWLGIAGAATIWLPVALRSLAFWPLLAAGIVGLAHLAHFAVGDAARILWGRFSTVASAIAPPGKNGGACLMVLALGSQFSVLSSQPEVPQKVYLLPHGNGPADGADVLVPPELLRQLDALASGFTPLASGSAPLLTSARYEGEILGNVVHFRAELHVRNFENSSILTIPLDSALGQDGGLAMVDDALIDDAKAFLESLRPQRPGYKLKIEGRGSHKILLRFVVPIVTLGDTCDLRFAIPRTARSQLVLQGPKATSDLQVLLCQGQQRVVANPKGVQLTADLGLTDGVLHVRWLREREQKPARLKVQESYFWQLRPGASRLEAHLNYSISEGAVNALRIGIPRGLEVQQVQTAVGTLTTAPRARRRSADPAAAGTPALGAGLPTLPEGGRSENLAPDSRNAPIENDKSKIENPAVTQPANLAPAPPSSWDLVTTAGNRELLVRFSSLVTGRVQVIVQLVPSQPFGLRLRPFLLPTPVAAESTERWLACKLDGLEVGLPRAAGTGDALITSPAALAGVTAIAPNDFVAHRQTFTREVIPLPTFACTFRREPRQADAVLSLRIPETIREAAQEIIWRVGHGRADFRATAHLAVPSGGGLLLVQWEVPQTVRITSVSGRQVRYWTRGTDSQIVQVWLNSNLPQRTELQLSGWVPIPDADTPSSPSGLADSRWQLPCLRLSGVGKQTTYLRLAGASGIVMTPWETRGLWPLPDARIPTSKGQWAAGSGQRAVTAGDWGEISYVAVGPNYQGTILVQPVKPKVDVQVLTRVETRDRNLVFIAGIDCRIHQGELRRLEVRLDNWRGGKARLEASRVTQRQQRDNQSTQFWVLELQPGVTGRYQLELRGSMSLPLTTSSGQWGMGHGREVLPLPDIRVRAGSDRPSAEQWQTDLRDRADAAGTEQRWLAVSGPDFIVNHPKGLAQVKEPEKLLEESWPVETKQIRQTGGTIWKIEADNWHLPLLLRSPLEKTNPVQLFLTEQQSSVRNGRRWQHETAFWLYHEAGADLTVLMPTAARILAFTVDGESSLPLQPETNRLWLPLPGGAGVRLVRFSWTAEADEEDLEIPDLRLPVPLPPPTISGHQGPTGSTQPATPQIAAPALWSVHVPAGYRIASGASGKPTAAQAAVELLRASAQLELSMVLAERVRLRSDILAPQFLAAQRRFYEHCRMAETKLTHSSEQQSALVSQLEELKARNRTFTQERGLEEFRLRAERQVPDPRTPTGERSGPMPGVTVLWWTGDASGSPPPLRLTAERTEQTRQKIAATLALSVAILGIWILSYFPAVTSWLRLSECIAFLKSQKSSSATEP